MYVISDTSEYSQMLQSASFDAKKYEIMRNSQEAYNTQRKYQATRVEQKNIKEC